MLLSGEVKNVLDRAPRLGWSNEMRVVVLTAGVITLVGLSACPSTVVCQKGTVACGSGCIDPNADKRNCGSCGIACGSNQECNAGSCACEAGTTSCNG